MTGESEARNKESLEDGRERTKKTGGVADFSDTSFFSSKQPRVLSNI